MSSNIQLIIVFIILALLLIWIIYRLVSSRGRKSGSKSSCCGCNLADCCSEKANKSHTEKDCNSNC